MEQSEPRLKDVLKRIRLDLVSVYTESEAIFLAKLLVEHFFRLKSYQLALNEDMICQPVTLRKLNQSVQRLKKHEPWQYILGQTEFCRLLLQVNASVLIPRPETEELVDWILANVSDLATMKILNPNLNAYSPHILDIGTGSGAIALALKNSIPSSKIKALDVSKNALLIARKNSSELGLELEFFEFNILDPSLWKLFQDNSFEMIVSNPPYVKWIEKERMHARVFDYEPALALFVSDENPLQFYKEITTFAFKKLKSGGFLYFEINEAYGEEVIYLLENENFTNIILRKDMLGKQRMIRGMKPIK